MNRLKVTLPFTGDEALSNIERILAHESYKKEFWRSMMPPHEVVYIFEGLSDEGVERWKQKFRETARNYIEPVWLSHCRFDVEKIDGK